MRKRHRLSKTDMLFKCLSGVMAILIAVGCLNTGASVVKAEEVKEIKALDLAKLMGNGINLGNTMEAYGHLSLGVDSEPSAYETLWGQPVTTKEMLLAMKEAGFDSIRIPVAWTNAIDYENGDYTIKKAYMDRVEEIVNYAIDADMYVVINEHWDGGWWGMFGSATSETREKAMELYVSMWSQIAERFQNYSDKLIFESGNEELGNRLNDVDVSPDSGALSENERYETTNRINQTFVDTIRDSGGNNSERFLLIAGYNTNIMSTIDDRFQMPEDSIANRLLISVHYYDPWSYAGSEELASWGSESEYKSQNDVLAKMTKFTDQGVGVIIGEYGVLPTKDGTIKENTTDFTKNLLDNCDLYGYVPMLWDTSSFFVRTDLKINDEGLAKLFKERSLSAQASLTEEEIKEEARQSLELGIAKGKENDRNNVGPILNGDEKAVAWIMYNSNDNKTSYSAGDTYDPTSKTEGVAASVVEIKGAGTYTTSLDFTGTTEGFANSVLFSALGISNGELLFPGYMITIKDIKVNGEPYKMAGVPYTTTDNKKTTRVNLHNPWVASIPVEARLPDGDLSNVSATVLDNKTLGEVKTISVTFDYGPTIPKPSEDTEAPVWAEGSTVTAQANTTDVTLTWAADTAADNVEVTAYKVTWKQGAELKTHDVTDGNATSTVIRGLKSSTNYSFKLEAGDAAGNWSDNGPAVTVTTKAYVPPVTSQPKPGQPVKPVAPVAPVAPVTPLVPEEPSEPVELVKPEQPQIEFIDVPEAHWAALAIKRAAALGIVQGYPDGTYKPAEPITRAQFIKMLSNAFKWQGEQDELIFTDNGEIGAWAKDAIAQAVNRGVINGYDDGSFRPNREITRTEMIVILGRVLGLDRSAIEQTGFADDATIPAWGKGIVEALRELVIVAGHSNNRFAPNDAPTRTEALVVILRALDLN
ncbi:cellulase family glycosylhydrolase [Paenibacillus xylanexedens]|uniref:cellulase family glycosylhydrolase n=1 Tax=Paenibacillus xylanexedens TaxID=528191 RepID=UPI000F52EFD5|nr:cellulase family glycosylhydrolase [Paenibacillus xylanexedens]RPK31414.1 Endoglucanase 1 precursor (Endoglucanase I) (Endo-1,4-beta-glucanase) (Cellulase) (EG-I) [Paenibacillus xylanexedens]